MVSTEIRHSRGILTEDDREFLTDDEVREGMTSGGRSQRWGDIRDRIRNGVIDFVWLVRELPPEQRRRVFQDDRLVDENDPKRQERVFAYLIAFAYQQLGDTSRLERATDVAVKRAKIQKGSLVNVNTHIATSFQYGIADIRQRFAEGGLDAIELYEINILWHAGEISSREHTILALEKGFPSGSEEFLNSMRDELEPE